MSYVSVTLLETARQLAKRTAKIELNGHDLGLAEILAVSRRSTQTEFTSNKKVLAQIQKTYQKMISDVRAGIPIYGCNTGYGERASVVLADGTPDERLALAKQFSEGIVHVDVTVGPEFETDVVRAAMLIRINMLMQGVSAVKLEDLDIYRQLLNKGLTPVVNKYGGIGASGDLAHNGRVLSAARQLAGTLARDEKGKTHQAKDLFSKHKIPALDLDPKAGLGLVNGDNFSSGLAALLAADTLEALLISHVTGALTVQVLKGSDRSFHPLLGAVRPHDGQQEVAAVYRNLLKGSKLAYQEMSGHVRREPGIKVQDGYSLRCIPQYHGVNVDKLKWCLDVITTNVNSASDNPLWVTPEYATEGEEAWQWVSGGNFIASHMVEVMDSLRKTMTQIVKLNDRHLARMVSPVHNNGLPANLSDPAALTQCAFKGVQIQSGMMEVYSALLSIPVSTFFGVHEEGNQDITSHALTSGILGQENLRLTRYSLAQNLVAIAQAVDMRGDGKLLSPATRPVYEFVRDKVKYVKRERPLHNDIEVIYDSIANGELMELLLKEVFKNT